MFRRPEVDHALCRYLASTLPVGNSHPRQLPTAVLFRLLNLAKDSKLPACYDFLPTPVWEDVLLVELQDRG